MITTGCDGCCFLVEEERGKGCSLGQFCILRDEQTIAPGYCRMCRSHKWAGKHKDDPHSAMIEERTLKMDMIVFFDEAKTNLTDLGRTLDSDWYSEHTNKVIIADVTGFGNDRKNLALQYVNKRDHRVPTIVDSSVRHEEPSQREETIRRLVGQVKSPFFLAIPAGLKIDPFHALAADIKHTSTRVVHWHFAGGIGKTIMLHNTYDDGLFITKPYRALIKSPDVKLFSEQIRKEEKETKMLLSWQCGNCWMI